MVDSGKFVWFGLGGSGVARGSDMHSALRAYDAGTYLEVKRDRGEFVMPTSVVPVHGVEEADMAHPASASASNSSGAPLAPSAQLVAATAACCVLSSSTRRRPSSMRRSRRRSRRQKWPRRHHMCIARHQADPRQKRGASMPSHVCRFLTGAVRALTVCYATASTPRQNGDKEAMPIVQLVICELKTLTGVDASGRAMSGPTDARGQCARCGFVPPLADRRLLCAR
jgi:hypothetical protein